MKNRSICLLIVSAAAAAAFLPGGVQGQQRVAAPQPSLEAPAANAPTGGTLGILQHGTWQCALPGDAARAAFAEVPAEGFRIGTASSYNTSAGEGIYLLRGSEVVFTRGPKKDQRFRRLGGNTLQKLNADGTLSKMICTRLAGVN